MLTLQRGAIVIVFWFSAKMRVNLTEEGFRPSGGDFQGMRIYRSDVSFFCFRAARDITPPWLIIVRDESVRLSLGMVASPQSPLPFHLTRFLSAMPPHCLRKISTQPVSPLLPARGAFWPTAASDLEPHGFPPGALPTLPAA